MVELPFAVSSLSSIHYCTGEENGVQYNFTSMEIFEYLIDRDVFLHWGNYEGSYYGVLMPSSRAIEGKNVQQNAPSALLVCVKNGVSIVINLFLARSDFFGSHF